MPTFTLRKTAEKNLVSSVISPRFRALTPHPLEESGQMV
jgi:hypothetical protein